MNHESHCRPRGGNPPVGEPHRHLVVFQRRLGGDRLLATDVVLQYEPADPYAVGVHFHAGTPNELVWMFAREQLAEGMFAPVGEGDIKVRPCPDDPVSVLIELSSPTGRAAFTADTADLSGFLYCTYDIVLPGAELSRIDFEHELSRLAADRDDRPGTPRRPAAEP